MKLAFDFETMEIGDEWIAVPVGDEAKRFHGVVNLNEVAAQMMKYISESSTPEEVHQKLCMDYPNDDPKEVGENLCEFLNWLVQQRLLIP